MFLAFFEGLDETTTNSFLFLSRFPPFSLSLSLSPSLSLSLARPAREGSRAKRGRETRDYLSLSRVEKGLVLRSLQRNLDFFLATSWQKPGRSSPANGRELTIQTKYSGKKLEKQIKSPTTPPATRVASSNSPSVSSPSSVGSAAAAQQRLPPQRAEAAAPSEEEAAPRAPLPLRAASSGRTTTGASSTSSAFSPSADLAPGLAPAALPLQRLPLAEAAAPSSVGAAGLPRARPPPDASSSLRTAAS